MLNNCAIHHGDTIWELVEEEACMYIYCFLFVCCTCFHSVQIGISPPILPGLQSDQGRLLKHQGLPTLLLGRPFSVLIGSCMFTDRPGESIWVFSIIGIYIKVVFMHVIFCNAIYKNYVNRIALGFFFSINCCPYIPPRPIPLQEQSQQVTAPSLHQHSM